MLGALSGHPNMGCISAHGNCTVVMVTSGVLYVDGPCGTVLEE